MSTSTYRLPTYASPRRYDVQLDAQLGREEFHGQVVIALDLHETTNIIELHARDLNITTAQVTGNRENQTAAVTLDPENERLILQFSEALSAGEATLKIIFTARSAKRSKVYI